nr:hypothetical protein [uncultured Methanolobus sp.]
MLDNLCKITKKRPFLIMCLAIIFIIVEAYVIKFPVKESSVNTTLNVMLVFVTAVYVVLTENILSDSEKSRKIEYKSSQLEKLYYPLLSVIEFSSELNMIDPEDYFPQMEYVLDFSNSNVDMFSNNRYLAREQSRPLISKILTKALVSKKLFISQDIYDKFCLAIEEDIGILIMDLEKLVDN